MSCSVEQYTDTVVCQLQSLRRPSVHKSSEGVARERGREYIVYTLPGKRRSVDPANPAEILYVARLLGSNREGARFYR